MSEREKEDRRRLPVVQPEPVALGRRRVLLLSGVALVAACSPSGGNPDVVDATLGDAEDTTEPIEFPDVAPGTDAGTGGRCSGRNTFDVGTLNDYPMGSLTLVPHANGSQTWIGRDERGIYAMDNSCPHFQGQMELEMMNGQTFLHCTQIPQEQHDSRFDREGRGVYGPVLTSMQTVLTYRPITPCEGRLVVDRARIAPFNSRTPV